MAGVTIITLTINYLYNCRLCNAEVNMHHFQTDLIIL